MAKKIKYSLLHSILVTDFLFIKNHSSLKNTYILNPTQLTKRKSFYTLNPLEVIKGIKQYIRIIQVFQNQKYKLILFFLTEVYQRVLIQKFLILNRLTFEIKFFLKFLNLAKTNKKPSLLFSFTELFLKPGALLKSFLSMRLFLVQEFVLFDSHQNLGTYKMVNDFFDYKKILLLLVLLFQVNKQISNSKIQTAFFSY